MVRIFNQEVGKKIVKELRVQSGADRPPEDTSEKVILNYQVNDPLFYSNAEPIARNATLVNATGPTTIFTTPTNKTFYLQSVSLAAAVGATHAGETVAILATIGGASRIIIQLEFQTTVALQGAQLAQNFPYPLRVDKGTDISIIADDSTDIEANACISGFNVVDQLEVD